MRTLFLAAALLSGTAASAQLRPDQAAFRGLYKELIETNTTVSAGSCTLAAERMAARMKAASTAAVFAPPPPPVYSAPVAARGGERLYTAGNLPQSSGVKAEYANSGRWIASPAIAKTADVNTQ